MSMLPAVTILLDTAILYFGILPWFWKISGNIVAYMGLDAENEIIHTLSFLAGVMIWSQQTIWLFFRDMFKGICLSILLGPPIVAAIIVIVQCKNEEEVVAVIAHELGHWKLNHTMYSFIAVQILTFLQFGGYTLVRNSKDLFQSFGFDAQPVLIGLVIFQHTVIPLQHLVSFGLNLVSRAFEFQADAFAKKLGYAAALRSGLVKLQEENLSAMNTDPWYSAYHYSHVPLGFRQYCNWGMRQWSRYLVSVQRLCHTGKEENLSAMNTDPWYSAYHYSHPPLVERLAALEEPGSKKED
ncbi:hypothetical protein COCNU_10G005900 [Cocos nucifera]|uniref:Peptidase M48 domain-containing protein n=1 Tax=Cocos nucifera TaxID=13894 RepID=A0A8K0IM32_COCNU|nr:hypothetical protein COCNU_10G005900 [Cocos nucifera]